MLTLQPDLQLSKLAHVLDGDDGLSGKGFDQIDQPVFERFDLKAEQRDAPDGSTVQHQRDEQNTANPDVVHHRMDNGAARLVKRAFAHIRKLDQLTVYDRLGGIGERAIHDHLALCEHRGHPLSQPAMRRQCLNLVPLGGEDKPRHRRITQGLRVLQNGFKDRQLVIAALADDAQNLSGRRLARQTVLQVTKLPGVFDGDDRLRGEGFDQCNLIRGKWVRLSPAQRDAAKRCFPAHQRHVQMRADTFDVHKFATPFMALPIQLRILQILKMHHPPLPHRDALTDGSSQIELRSQGKGPPVLSLGGQHSQMCARLIEQKQTTALRMAELFSPIQNGAKDRQLVIAALIDDVQYLAGRRGLPKGLGKPGSKTFAIIHVRLVVQSHTPRKPTCLNQVRQVAIALPVDWESDIARRPSLVAFPTSERDAVKVRIGFFIALFRSAPTTNDRPLSREIGCAT